MMFGDAAHAKKQQHGDLARPRPASPVASVTRDAQRTPQVIGKARTMPASNPLPKPFRVQPAHREPQQKRKHHRKKRAKNQDQKISRDDRGARPRSGRCPFPPARRAPANTSRWSGRVRRRSRRRGNRRGCRGASFRFSGIAVSMDLCCHSDAKRGITPFLIFIRRTRIITLLLRMSARARHQMRRSILGNSCQTFMPQKCEPSVQIGVAIPARM